MSGLSSPPIMSEAISGRKPIPSPQKINQDPKMKTSGHAIDLNRPNLKRSKQQIPPQDIPDDFKRQVDFSPEA